MHDVSCCMVMVLLYSNVSAVPRLLVTITHLSFLEGQFYRM